MFCSLGGSGIQLAHNNALEELLAWDRCGNCNAGSSEQTNHSIPRTTWEDLVDPSKLLLAFSDPGSTDSIRSRSATDQTNTITATLRDGDGHTAAEAAFTSLAKDLDKQCNITTADTLQTFAPEDHLDQRTDAGNTVSEELATNMPTEDEFWTWDEQRQRFVHKEKNGREIVCPTWFD
ncbi:hypothetical protein QC762_407107 [Podospora pseudocomata]|uniref:Uncharacterized protein n=1 Tax=Podospora pseudocomata TaxID=2093779 RepID=A0ABR0GGD5_9PEZI|nr:hypothetical protein QC762_407107 [Podospora pseudocomata]